MPKRITLKINKTYIMKSFCIRLFLFVGGPLLFIKAKGQNSQVLSEFTRIKVEDNVQVELIIADRYSIYTEGNHENSSSYEINAGELLINTENTKGGGYVKVYTKKITAITLEGASRIESLDTLRGNAIQIKLEDASKAKLVLAATYLSVETEGASQCILSGTAETTSAKVEDASKLNAPQLITQNLTIETNGQAKATVHVQNTLQANASDLSKLNYIGNPVNKNITKDDIAKVENIPSISQITIEKDFGLVETERSIDIKDNKAIPNDTTRLKIGSRRLMIIEDKKKESVYGESSTTKNNKREMKSLWGGFELGVQSFVTPQMDFNLPTGYSFLNTNIGNSWHFGINLPEYDLHIVQNKLALTTGFGLQWSNLNFSGNSYLTPNVDSIAPTSSAAGTNLNRNKLRTFDYRVPLLIKFAPGTHQKANGGFHVAVGVIGHYTRNSKVITETSSLGYNNREELKDDFNINPFRADATVRIGYDKIKLFANYSLTPYFRNNAQNPDIRLFAAGITLIGF